MKKETGWVTTEAVTVAAVFGFSHFTSRAPFPPTQEQAQVRKAGAKERPPKEASQSKLRYGCGEIKSRLERFLSEKGGRFPDSCVDSGEAPPMLSKESKAAELHFLIVTLPDPVHTHFSLLFDRAVEATAQAAEDQGYNYDSSWLPWVEQSRDYAALKDQLLSEALREYQEQQPGVMVFRKDVSQDSSLDKGPYEEGLIIFLVGEYPTGGIKEEQFRNAVKWIGALRPNGTRQSLRVLGPTFSGSFPSLLRVLRDKDVAPFVQTNRESITVPNLPKIAETRPVEVMSGSATSPASIQWFKGQLAANPGGRFLTFLENDDVMTDRYCQFLEEQGYDPAKLAIVSEDETAYGALRIKATPHDPYLPDPAQIVDLNTVDLSKPESIADVPLPHCNYIDTEEKKPHGPLYFYYPRDIASLRSAYEKQSILSPGSQREQTNSPRTALQDDLSEPSNSEHDTVRTYGGSQTPLSQESTLYEMTNLLKAHRVEFIILRSSNPLDQIFLVRFLRRSYPEGRIVLATADLLFRRNPETENLRGTLTLSTFPLLSWQEDWTYWQRPDLSHSHRAFTMEGAQGAYLAGRFLIDSDDGPVDDKTGNGEEPPLKIGKSSILVQDYGPPSWLLTCRESVDELACQQGTRPPTWLSVVGNGQFWPVAALDASTLLHEPSKPLPFLNPKELRPEDLRPAQGTLHKAVTNAKYHAASLVLPLPMRICFLVSLLWAVWHLYCCYSGSQTASPRCLAYFSPIGRRQQKILIFIGSAVIALWAVVLATVTGVFSRGGAPFYHPDRLILLYVSLLLFSLAALVASRRVCRSQEQVKPEEQRMSKNEKLRDELNQLYRQIVTKRKQLRELRRAQLNSENVKKATAELQRSRRLRWTIRRIYWEAQRRRVVESLKLARTSVIVFSVLVAVLVAVFYHFLTAQLTDADKVFTLWRSVNLFTGVSPLMPLLLLTLGMYGWFWFTLSGLALFNKDRPRLPRLCDLLPVLPMFSREGAGHPIELRAIPLSRRYGICLGILLCLLLTVFVFFTLAENFAVRGLGSIYYGRIFLVWLDLCVAVTLADAWQMQSTWSQLRQLLVYLDRMPLRRTLDALKGFSWGTVWKMGGNVLEQRYRLLSRQIESLQHLKNTLRGLKTSNPAQAPVPQEFYDELKKCEDAIAPFATWFSKYHNDPELCDTTQLANLQKKFSKMAGFTMTTILIPSWHDEKESLILDYSRRVEGKAEDKKDHPAASIPEHLRAAEEFFLLPYLGFIQNILGRIRTMVMGMLCLFLAATLSVASYPFDPRPVLSGIFLFVFVVVGTIVFFVYAQMHRDTTLSHITNTTPGELGMEFWLKLVAVGAGPLLALLTALFPEIANFVGSWLQPSVEAIK